MRKDTYADRKYIVYGFFILVGILFLIRLSYLQLYNDDFKLAADNNTRRDITIYPPRGLIYDRNDNLIVYNEAVFDLMLIPNQLEELDTLTFCNLVGITKEEFKLRIKKAKKYSYRKASFFEKQISKERTAYIQEKLYNYPGFYVQARTLRKYPFPIAAHVLGYIGEVGPKHLEQDDFYAQGDYVGISGIEKFYEKDLRGVKGVRKLMVDVFNREKGAFHNGIYDINAQNGKNLYTGIDYKLQEYGERLMQNKIGAIVAIEPKTGEIIAMVASPSYDPNLLTGRIRSKNYHVLLNDTLKPLLNRALISSYPPGSTFKLINALIGLQEGVLHNNTHYPCHSGFHFKNLTVGCHSHKSPLNLEESIQYSCNAYYCNVYRSIIDNKAYSNSEMGFRKWKQYANNMGFGVKYGIDLPSEKRGNIPKPEYYDKYYGKGHWNAITTISLSIGQGEILATPLQMANQAAFIANRGYYMTPHVVRAIGHKDSLNPRFTERHYVGVDREHFDIVVEAMAKVVSAGTARLARIDSVEVCGKTGTVQNPHGENHSVFIAFAPRENPQIAIAVFVENSGYGGTWAAPISSLMIEKYLKGYINSKRNWLEKRMLEGNLLSRQ
ncbi:MAG: penicillin-binding protein 2 [Bacteroidetes bacterium]|nr:MAG: penicillin-binding protein 2 [Bacteroidota bacterium]